MLERYENQFSDLKSSINALGADIIQAVDNCEKGMDTLDIKSFDAARDTVKNVENQANKIDQDIVRILALFEPEAIELRELVAYLKITSELVRLSDNLKSFSKRMKSHLLNEADMTNIKEYATHLAKSSFKSVVYAIEALSVESKDEITDLFRKASVEESKTDDLYTILEKNIMTDLMKNIEDSAESIQILSTMRKLERMADRSVNITKLMMFAQVGGDINQF